MLLWKIFKRISGNWRSMITGRKNWHVPFMLNSKIGYMLQGISASYTVCKVNKHMGFI